MTISPGKSVRIGGSLALLLSLAVTQPHLSAQSQATTATPTEAARPPLRFEVASIHLHPFAGDEPSNRRVLPGGHFVATNTTVRALIRIAFAIDSNLISGAPGWIDSETFDINGTTVDRTEIKTPQQLQELMLSLLEDRFQFRFHREQKEGPVYRLVLDKTGRLGPALKPSAPDSKPNMSTNSNGLRAEMKASKMSMADIAAALRRQAGRPVEDHTGIKGDFDLQIAWAPEETPDSTNPSLFTVLREQLGLKLQPAKGTIETLVIDHIDHPSAN